jgi:hypothetical protein
MARTKIPGVIISMAVPWALGAKAARGYYFKRAAPWMGNRAALSAPQLKACIALASAATEAYGKRGKAPYKGVNMPIVAVEVAKKVPKGAKAHGGLTREERSKLRHEATPASIENLKALLAKKAAA